MIALLFVLSAAPVDPRVAELAAGWRRANHSAQACEALGPLLLQAERLRVKPVKPLPPATFDCKKSTVCLGRSCEPLVTVLAPYEGARLVMHGQLKILTDDFAPGYLCPDLASELTKMRVGDSWRHVLRVDCTWRVVCSDGPDGVPGNADDVCQAMR